MQSFIIQNSLRELLANVDRLEEGAELNNISVTMTTSNGLQQEIIHHTDENFTKVFPLELTSGSSEGVFSEPGKILISTASAQRLFNSDNPTGKVLELNNKLSLVVAGVFEPFPVLSNLGEIKFLTGSRFITGLQDTATPATTVSTNFYLRLSNDVDISALEQQISPYMAGSNSDFTTSAQLIPLVKSLPDHLANDTDGAGIARYMLLFALGLCLIVLFTSCINFINLTTARQSQRNLEVGIRKTVGAHRSQLVVQFFAETTMMVIAACLIAVPLTFGLLQWLIHLTGISTDLSFLTSWGFAVTVMGIIGFTSLLAGFYPALILSRFSPVQALKNKLEKMSAGKLRKVLVVVQFSVATILVACCLIVHLQILEVKNTDSGIDNEKLMSVNGRFDEQWQQQRKILIHELQKLPGVVSTSNAISNRWLSVDYEFNGTKHKGTEFSTSLVAASVDSNYASHFGIELLAGRHLDSNRPEDIGSLAGC